MADVVKSVNVVATWDGSKLTIGAKEAEKAIERIKNEGKDAGNSLSKSFSDAAERVKKNFLAITGAVAASAIAVKKLFDFGKEAAEFEESAQVLRDTFGKSVDEVLLKLDQAAGGTVSKQKLLAAANKAFALNATQDVDTLARLMEIAKLKADQFGITTTEAFEQMTAGIGKATPKLIESLGFSVDAWTKQAEATGKALTQADLLRLVLQSGGEQLKATGQQSESLADKIEKAEAAFENIKLTIGQKLAPVIDKSISLFIGIGNVLQKVPGWLIAAGAAASALIPAVSALSLALGPVGIAITAIGAAIGIIAAARAAATIEDSSKAGLIKDIERLESQYAKTAKVKAEALETETRKTAELLYLQVKQDESIKNKSATEEKAAKQRRIDYEDLIISLRQQMTITESLKNTEIKLETKLSDKKKVLKGLLDAEEASKKKALELEQKRKAEADKSKEEEKQTRINKLKAEQAIITEEIYQTELQDAITEKIEKQKKLNEQLKATFEAQNDIISQVGGEVGGAISAARSAGRTQGEVGRNEQAGMAAKVGSTIQVVGAIIGIIQAIAGELKAIVVFFEQWGSVASNKVGKVIKDILDMIIQIGNAGGIFAMFQSWEQSSKDFNQTIIDQAKSYDEIMRQMTRTREQFIRDQERETFDERVRLQQEALNATYKTALEALRISSGLAAVDEADRKANREQLENDLANEIDVEKKASLQRRLDRLNAEELYAEEKAKLDAKKKSDDDALNAEIKAEENIRRAEDKAIAKIERDFQRTVARQNIEMQKIAALAQAASVAGFSNDQYGRITSNADIAEHKVNTLYDDIFARFDSIPAFARGGSFMTNGPQLIMVGDNPGGRERVDVTPGGKPLSGMTFNGPITIQANNIDEFSRSMKAYERRYGRIA